MNCTALLRHSTVIRFIVKLPVAVERIAFVLETIMKRYDAIYDHADYRVIIYENHDLVPRNGRDKF